MSLLRYGKTDCQHDLVYRTDGHDFKSEWIPHWGKRVNELFELEVTKLDDDVCYLSGNPISDLTPLSGLTQLMYLDLPTNLISDLTPLSGLTQLTRLYLSGNQISDIRPLMDSAGLDEGDTIDLRGNALNDEAYDVHIPVLQARGVNVYFDPKTGVSEAQESRAVPSAYALYPNTPNPFNPGTSIAYDLPEAAEVSLSIYNGLGQQIATLVSAQQKPGHYTVSWDAKEWASGMYFYRLEAGSFSETRRMLLLR